MYTLRCTLYDLRKSREITHGKLIYVLRDLRETTLQKIQMFEVIQFAKHEDSIIIYPCVICE